MFFFLLIICIEKENIFRKEKFGLKFECFMIFLVFSKIYKV